MRRLLVFLSVLILCFVNVACSSDKSEEVQKDVGQQKQTKEEARKQFYDTSDAKKKLEAFRAAQEKKKSSKEE